jgi:hypothetical protein
VWTALTNATATGNNIEHNGGGYFAKGQSVQTISGPGYFEWRFDGEYSIVGLGNNNDEGLATGYSDLDFAFSFGSPTTYSIREQGNYKSDGSAVAGDVFRIEIASNGDVIYKKNGQTVYTTSNPNKGYPYYLVFKTQEAAGNGISAAVVQTGTPSSPLTALFEWVDLLMLVWATSFC